MNIKTKLLLLASVNSITSIFADPTQDLFTGIYEHNFPKVVAALDAGADINAFQASGYQFTPLMAAIDELNALIVNTHDTKRFLLGCSFLAGIATPVALDYCDVISSWQANLAVFGGAMWGANRIFKYLFTKSKDEDIAQAFGITNLLIAHPALQPENSSPITGQTAHQMIGACILNAKNALASANHFIYWRSCSNESFLARICSAFIVGIIIGTVNAIDTNILQKNLESAFMPLAQELYMRSRSECKN